MKKQILLVVAACLGFGASGFAQVVENIEFDALANKILNPNGSTAADGDIVRLGLFPTGFNFSANQTFSSLDAAFTQLGTTSTIGGQFTNDIVNTTSGFEGRELYIWVLNSSTPATANAWVILTDTADTNWKVPNDGANTIIDAGDPAVFVPIGALGISVPNANSPNGKDWEMQSLAAVPEPSTYASTLLGLSGFALVSLRRRFRK
jgi:hypothetical protein